MQKSKYLTLFLRMFKNLANIIKGVYYHYFFYIVNQSEYFNICIFWHLDHFIIIILRSLTRINIKTNILSTLLVNGFYFNLIIYFGSLSYRCGWIYFLF